MKIQDREQVQAKLLEIIKDYHDDFGEQTFNTDETILISDLGLNSYELIELISVIEQEFDIDIPDRAIAHIKTVQDLSEFIVTDSVA